MVLLNSDGTLNNRFENLNLTVFQRGFYISAYISKIKLIDNGLMICGSFSKINGVDTLGAVYVDLDGNPTTYFSNLLNNPNPPFGTSAVYDVEKLNGKYYFTTVNEIGTVNGDLSLYGRDPNHDYVNFDYKIISSNLDGSLNSVFTPITISAYKKYFVNVNYVRYPEYAQYLTSPANLLLKAKSNNMLNVFGTYTSLNNEPHFGLSRIIIDDNLSTSYNQFSADSIKCYPNPTNSIVNISATNETINQINIYDMLGSLLKSQKGSSDNEQINIQELPNGIYLVKVKTDQGTQTIKINKQ